MPLRNWYGVKAQVLPLAERTGTGFTEPLRGYGAARSLKLYLTCTALDGNNAYVSCLVQETVDGVHWFNLDSNVEFDGTTTEPVYNVSTAFDNKTFSDVLRIKWEAADDDGDVAATFRLDWVIE